MKKPKNIVDLIINLNKIIEKPPPLNEIKKEVLMMNFKMKPILGDLTEVQINHPKFITTLWKLGKLDEFFQKEINKIPKKQLPIFIEAFEDIFEKYQKQLNDVKLITKKDVNLKTSILEVEIFKDQEKKIN